MEQQEHERQRQRRHRPQQRPAPEARPFEPPLPERSAPDGRLIARFVLRAVASRVRLADAAPDILSGAPPDGAFYAFVKINPDWAREAGVTAPSLSWAMAEHLIRNARIGCVPGVDFGPGAEGYLRFCFGRERNELTGALASMKAALAQEVGR